MSSEDVERSGSNESDAAGKRPTDPSGSSKQTPDPPPADSQPSPRPGSESRPDRATPSAKPAPKVAPKSTSSRAAKSAVKASRRSLKLPERPGQRRRLLRFGVLALALLVGLIAWLATRGDDGESSVTPAAKAAATRIVEVDELREAAAVLGQPIYWAGPIAGQELELKELDEGVQVVYLPAGTPAGQGSAKSLTVGSYPLADPAKSLEGFARRPGSVVHHAEDGREVVVSEQTPTSVFFASPENSVQVEVYDPSPQRALGLALTGRAQPAG